jgi:CBS-domain-containing membrane protein
VKTVHESEDAGVLTRMFADGLVGLVVDDEHQLRGLVSKMDLVDFLTKSTTV